MKGWKFAVDTGGTFTDVVGLDPRGRYHVLKLLSDSPEYENASIEGIRRMLGLGGGPLPGDLVEAVRFGTTAATNALLERKGGRVALMVTGGFRDLLEIGHQSRPDIFSLCIEKPPVLYSDVFEVAERIDGRGNVVRRLDAAALRRDVAAIGRGGFDAVCVVLMHAWKNPAHELLCGEVLREHGIENVFLSHRSANLIKIIGRGQGAVLDAYLDKALGAYVEAIVAETGPVRVELMQSAGGLSEPRELRGKDALLSGPAGGVVAVAAISDELGLRGAIGFDMGGTSTDVSRYDGEIERLYERSVAGVEFHGEMLNIVTIASGGGSVLRFDGERMRVGPDSSGAYPGPACYGFGGPLSVTDANLMTGRLLPEYFPRTFGPGRDAPLDAAATAAKFEEMAARINSALSLDMSPRDAAQGFLRVVNEQMAMAIKEISVSRGFDVRDYALVCFGGAAGQHACSVASILGMERIVFHPLGSLMSAYGIGLARPVRKCSRTVLEPYDEKTHAALEAQFAELQREAGGGAAWVSKEVDIRPRGADSSLTVRYRGFRETAGEFRQKYRRLFGFYPDDAALEVVNLRVELSAAAPFFRPYPERQAASAGPPSPSAVQRVFCSAGGAVDAPVYRCAELPGGFRLSGPALLVDGHTTLVIEPGFEAEVDGRGIVVIDRVGPGRAGPDRPGDAGPEPVLLEVFNYTFMAIAAEMGHVLRNTAHSVNIKERRDFSCAVFDSSGGLVANAPHIPVHLGAMSDTVGAVIADRGGDMRPGDAYLTNNPYRGGSHLPDMTVVCPVFSAAGELRFFTASRGHHADMGGVTPGSMPPEAGSIEEEGVLVENFLLVRDETLREAELVDLLSGRRHPVRNMRERLWDLRAQVAACHKGAQELGRVIQRYGWQTVRAYMAHIQDNAERSVKKALHGIVGDGGVFSSEFEDRLDDGTPIRAKVTIDAGSEPPGTLRAEIDFTGTGGQHETDNLNAPLSVTRSAVLYVLRAITGEDIPLNGGCLRPVQIRVPERSVLNPSYPCAVASGNVETSQRVVDVLLGALGVAAASQGTMNNVLFEVEGETPYYETVAGGAGAAAGCPGASGVQVHMTNTRMTDPEVLEHRHPGVRLRRFTLRRGSGGQGRYPGGQGVVRELEFLRPASVSVISERRVYAPYGLAGGGPGARGGNYIRHADGSIRRLPHRFALDVAAGESIVIKTPGGGGFGTAGD